MQRNAVFIFKIKNSYLRTLFVTKTGLLVTKMPILVTKNELIGTKFGKTGIKHQIHQRTTNRVL